MGEGVRAVPAVKEHSLAPGRAGGVTGVFEPGADFRSVCAGGVDPCGACRRDGPGRDSRRATSARYSATISAVAAESIFFLTFFCGGLYSFLWGCTVLLNSTQGYPATPRRSSSRPRGVTPSAIIRWQCVKLPRTKGGRAWCFVPTLHQGLARRVVAPRHTWPTRRPNRTYSLSQETQAGAAAKGAGVYSASAFALLP